MKTLVIERDKWLRGYEQGGTALLRSHDGKMCCLGFYLRSCGVAPEKIAGLGTPVECDYGSMPDEASWLLFKETSDDCADDSTDCRVLMGINDDETATEVEREHSIALEFGRHDIQVVFK